MSSLCLIHETIGDHSAIAKVAATDVRIALEAGLRVSVVANDLDPALRDSVEWLRLHVPKRLFAYQWLSGRRLIKRAMAGRAFDIVHAHQPQVADLSDIFQCHFLTRMAYLNACLERRKGLRPAILRAQQQIVLYAEDAHYRRWNPKTWMLYDSSLTRDHFHRLYGTLPREDVLVYNMDPVRPATADERRQARIELIGSDYRGIVVGFLGGVQERKGFGVLVEAVRREPNLFLLMAGPYSEGAKVPELAGRFRSLGTIRDIDTFYAACDVFAVPSQYEPLGLVAFEAASHGLPVFATPEVGALPHLIEHGAGVRWARNQPLGPLVQHLCDRRDSFNAGAARLAEELSLANYARKLIGYYERVLASAPQRFGTVGQPCSAAGNRSAPLGRVQ